MDQLPNSPFSAPELTVGEIVASLGNRLGLAVVSGDACLDRAISSQAVQKAGLVMAGLFQYYHPERLQVLGMSEMHYLEAAGPEGEAMARRLCEGPVPAFLIAYGKAPPRVLLEAARRTCIPVLVSPLSTDKVLGILLRFLATRLAPRVRVHGVLIDIFGLGVLILGESGIGKSECALELVMRGHRLVADDLIEIRWEDDQLVGASPEITRHLMEVRGLGIINAIEMFGVTSTLESKVVEQVVRLFRYEPGMTVDRLGVHRHWEILGVRLPLMEIPVAPGRTLSALLEMAARLQLLRGQGKDASRDLEEALARKLAAEGEEGR